MATAPKSAMLKPGTDENEIQLDFRNVKPRGGGRAAQIPPGDVLLEVISAKNVAVKNKPSERQIAWQFRVVAVANQDEDSINGIGDTVYTNTGLGENSIWFLRNLLDDLLGVETTGKAPKVRLDDKVGKQVGATLNWGKPYGEDNTIRSEIKATFPAARFIAAHGGATQAQEDDEPVEVEAPKPAAAPKARSNGVATPAAAAEAVSTADEDEDLEELQIQSL